MTLPSAAVFAYSLVGHEALEAVLETGWNVKLVVTHRDAPGENIWFPSVEERAKKSGAPVLLPESGRDPAILEAMGRAKPDFLLSFYFRWMLPVELLEAAPRGAFNLHGSLLPRFRGKASIHWQILEGEKEAGVTLHRMVAKADAGGIVAQQPVPIGPDETALELTRAIAEAGRRLLRETLPRLADGSAEERPMDLSAGFYRGGRRPEDGRIEWRWPARRVHDLVRAVGHPFPGAFTEIAGRRLWIWSSRVVDEETALPRPGQVLNPNPLVVACGSGALEIVRGQLDGEEEKPGSELLLPGREIS